MSDDEPINSAKSLAAAYYQDVVPQLQDDALGDPDVLESVLGQELYDRATRSIVVLDPEELVTRLATEFSADAEAPHG